MARPFNFLQFNTGVTGAGGWNILTGDRYFTPVGLIGHPINYFFPISMDSDYTPLGVNLSPYANINTTNLHEVGVNNKLSGNFYPVSQESGVLIASFTGQVSGDNIDRAYYAIGWSGNVASGDIDLNVYSMRFTGSQAGMNKDIEDYSVSFSGQLVSGELDLMTFSIGMSGNVVKKDKDNILLFIGLSGAQWRRGHARITGFTGENINLQIEMSEVSWRGNVRS